MQCYLLEGSTPSEGLRARWLESEDGKAWGVLVGIGPSATPVAIDERKADVLTSAFCQLVKRADGFMGHLDMLDNPGFQVTQEQAAEQIKEVESIGFQIWDVDYDLENQSIVPFRALRGEPQPCLLQVAVGVNKDEGALEYYAQSFREYEKDGRNQREYNSWDKRSGVTECATGHGFFDENHSLLRLVPGAGIRLRQRNPVPGMWDSLSINWTGWKLNVRPYSRRDRAQ